MRKYAEQGDPKPLYRVAVRTTLLYALAGVLWILFSDRVVALFVHDPDAIIRIQIFKGWFYVAVTSVLLYLVLRAQFRLWEREFTERTKAVRALAESEQRFRTLAEQASDGIFIADSRGRCVDANAAGCQMFGYSRDELIGARLLDVVDPSEGGRLTAEIARLLSLTPAKSQWRLKRRNGTIFHGEVNARRLPDGRFLGVVRDITERLTLEEQLRQAQKMEAVGQLAGGIAHDFNNLLTVILGSCELAIASTEPDSPARALIENIREGGNRAATLTRQLLTFSRRAVLEPKVLDLSETVKGTEQLLLRLLTPNITLVLELEPMTNRVLADPGQIGQVLMNLVANAREAMPEEGSITIRTSAVVIDEQDAALDPALKIGRWILLSVSDTGTGMTPEVMARVFEPFFTTKPTGKGTGLGLSMVFGIVNQSGGFIRLRSAPGKGSSFDLYFPEVDLPLEPRDLPPAVVPITRGGGTVLVVEDESHVRRVIVMALEGSVSRVLQASCGADAIRMVDQGETGIDLVVTDMEMPEMNGRELAEELRTRIPDLKVLFVSGYTDDEFVRFGVQERGAAFIQKPFMPQALSSKVREMLDITPRGNAL